MRRLPSSGDHRGKEIGASQQKVASPRHLVSDRPVPSDRYVSALEQVPATIVQHPSAAWSEAVAGRPGGSPAGRELATLLLAVNYELLGYSPAHAWLLAERGEASAPGSLDG